MDSTWLVIQRRGAFWVTWMVILHPHSMHVIYSKWTNNIFSTTGHYFYLPATILFIQPYSPCLPPQWHRIQWRHDWKLLKIPQLTWPLPFHPPTQFPTVTFHEDHSGSRSLKIPDKTAVIVRLCHFLTVRLSFTIRCWSRDFQTITFSSPALLCIKWVCRIVDT